RAHGSPEDRLLRDGRIAHAQRSELFEESRRRLEHAAGTRDIFAQKHHVGVAFHLLRDAARYGIPVGQFRHAQPPSAYTSVQRISSEGMGAALHLSVASSTRRRTSASMS